MKTTVALTVHVPEEVAELAARMSTEELSRAIEHGVIRTVSARHAFEQRMAKERA